MGVNIARISAVVIIGGEAGADKDLDEEFYICKEETAVWIKQYDGIVLLTCASGNILLLNRHLAPSDNNNEGNIDQSLFSEIY